MILRSIGAAGLGCFADALTVGPFAPGINVVYAPNATGKSTLFRAVSLAFLEPHRGKSAEVQALRPWGRRLTPEVAVEFEHSGRVYRVRKRFLDGASAQVETSDGGRWTSFAQGDHADEFLRELLQTESEKPRSSKREHWGLAQVLWTTQGDLTLPPLGASVIESIRRSVGAQLGARDAGIEARVREEYEKFFSPGRGKLKSGRGAAPQSRLEAERDRLEGELQAAEVLWRQLESESKAIEQWRAAATSASTRREALAQDLARGRGQVEAYGKLRSEQKERSAAREGAQAKYKAVDERIHSIERARQQIVTCESSLAGVREEVPALRSQLEVRRKSAEQGDAVCAAAKAGEAMARAGVETAQLADEYVCALAKGSSLARRLADIAAEQAGMASAAERKAALHAPGDGEIRELRAVLAQEADARRRLEMARITVAFVPDTRIEVQVTAGERPGMLTCEAGVRVLLAGAPKLTFTILGVGEFEANGPVADYEPVRRGLEKYRVSLAGFQGRFGSTDADLLDTRRQEAAELDARIREARGSIGKLLEGSSEAGLRENYGALAQRIREMETAHAGWRTDPPDAAALMKAANLEMTFWAARRNEAETAARAAQAIANHAETQLKMATGRAGTLEEHLEQARNLLACCEADGLSDGDRRKLRDQAALDYDAGRIALERIEGEFKQFKEDPALAAQRIEGELASFEKQARNAQDQLIAAEARMQGVVERRPYAAMSEISERLAVVGEQLERERRRMNALALLHDTLAEARDEMMLGVAAPVERIATDYLEQICGSAVAEIRLNEALAAERAIPAALADSNEGAVEIERFSGGEREQIFLCTRIALGSELARGERQMVVLDDVLTSTDSARMERICRLLTQASNRLQVVILTCHPERFASLPGANRIDLLSALERNGAQAGREVRAHQYV